MRVELIKGLRVKYDYVKEFDSTGVIQKVQDICDASPMIYVGKNGTVYAYDCGFIKVYLLLRDDGRVTMYVDSGGIKPGEAEKKRERNEKYGPYFMSLILFCYFVIIYFLPPSGVWSAMAVGVISGVIIALGYLLFGGAYNKMIKSEITLKRLKEL